MILLQFFRIRTAEHRPLPNIQTEQEGKGRKKSSRRFRPAAIPTRRRFEAGFYRVAKACGRENGGVSIRGVVE
jgi:hypothetical protein